MLTTPTKLWASVLALVFLAAHLANLPATLEDIDSLNFALGIHEFDPAKHQPHPPGYPIFIALSKAARLVMPSDAAAMSVLGAIFGALAVFPILWIFRHLESLSGRPPDRSLTTAALATALTVACPLYWFNAGRPMSDVPGVAATFAAAAALVAAFVRQRLNPERTPEAVASSGRMIVLGAFLSAIAIGMRTQALWMTLPLLAVVLVQRAGRGAAGALLGSAMAFAIGVLLWLVPLVAASGGPSAYVGALGAQGGEDFAGVDMLYLNPTPRRLAFNLLETFIYPWASPYLGWSVFALAFAGGVVLLVRSPRAAILLGVLAGPYLAVHLLLQETLTTRYALPFIPVVAYLAVRGAEAAVPTFRTAGPAVIVAILTVWSLVVVLPSARVYARDGAPAFAAMADLHARLAGEAGAVAMHHSMRRSIETQDMGRTRVLPAPPMREWLELAKYWREGATAPVWFLADPARTDIELVDPLSRTTVGHYVWGFPRLRFMSGSRPDVVDLIRIESPPGWFAEEGWHLTPETLNVSERRGRREGVAYIRRRPEAALMILGAHSLGAPSTVTVQIDDRPIAVVEVPAGGRVFKKLLLDRGALDGGAPLRRLVASYAASDGTPQRVRLTEFAVSPLDAVYAIPHEGWNEIEYSSELQRRWRWTAGRAQTFVNAGGKDVTLTIAGESPLRYFDTPPEVVVKAGDRVLARATPAADFEISARIPADVLAAADGTITIETSQTFVPHERSGSPDRRTLGLRIFTLSVR